MRDLNLAICGGQRLFVGLSTGYGEAADGTGNARREAIMKNRPHLLVINAEHGPAIDPFENEKMDSESAKLLKGLSELQESGIDVYFAQRNFEGIGDMNNGLRFIKFCDEDFPKFGELEYLVMIGGFNRRKAAMEAYPNAEFFFWPPEGGEKIARLKKKLKANRATKASHWVSAMAS